MMPLSPNARRLGYAGLLPQAAALMAVAKGGEWGWSALALSYGYAALIFSFLGGVWWGVALATPGAPRWAYAVAVMPCLIALALWWPWMVGETWPGPELIALGALIAASPLIDGALALWPAGWLALRWRLSLGLGTLTMAIGLIAH